MKYLIIGNFRSGTWYLHDKLVKDYNLISFNEIFYGNQYDVNDRLEEYSKTENCIAKIFPVQFVSKDDNILSICSKFCKVADKIIYTQRINTKEQVVSYAVASLQNDSLYSTPWLKDRNVYEDKLSDETLDKAFKRLEKNDQFIQKLFDIFPGKVYTLEKDFEFEPYPNKYEYNGNWQLPYEFKMLGENNA